MAGHRGQAEFRKPPAAFMAPAMSAPAFRTLASVDSGTLSTIHLPRWEEVLITVVLVAVLIANCLVFFWRCWIAWHANGGGGSSKTERAPAGSPVIGRQQC